MHQDYEHQVNESRKERRARCLRPWSTRLSLSSNYCGNIWLIFQPRDGWIAIPLILVCNGARCLVYYYSMMYYVLPIFHTVLYLVCVCCTSTWKQRPRWIERNRDTNQPQTITSFFPPCSNRCLGLQLADSELIVLILQSKCATGSSIRNKTTYW